MLKSRSKIVSLDYEPLQRNLTVMDLFAIGYGDLGSSIYYALGITALYALGATPLALMLAGLVFVCTALTYAEMTSCFKDSGGSASFARHAFNDMISFLAGWGLLLDYIVTIAISAFSIAPYLSYFMPSLKETSFQIGITSGVIVILFVMNLIGIRESTRVSLGLTLFTLITQTIVVAIASFTTLDLSVLWENLKINSGGPFSPTWPEFWKGTAMAMVAYTGIESIAQLGAEAKNPQRNVPKAIVLTMYVLVAMYFMLSAVALSAVSPHDLGTIYEDDPIAGIVAKLPFGSSVLSPWLGILAASILFVAANAGLIGASRLSFNLGEYYQLPRFFYKLHPKFKTPYLALTIFTILSVLIILASRGELYFLADLYNFGAMLAFTSAHFSLIALRIKNPGMKRPYKLPLNIKIKNRYIPISAVVGGLATLSVWTLVVITKPQGRYLGIGWMLIGLGMYYYYRKRRRLKPFGRLEIEKVYAPKFKPLKIKNILVTVSGINEISHLLKIALDTAIYHKAKIYVADFMEIPHTAPLDTDLISPLTSSLKEWQAMAESHGVGIEVHIIRARSLSQALVERINKSHIDLVIIEQAPKELLQRLRDRRKTQVWICR